MKLNFGKLLYIGAIALLGCSANAQEDTDRECKRMRFLAGEAVKVENYAEASMYYLKGEKICGGYDQANWERLVGCLMNTLNAETDDTRKTAYTDTLVNAFERQEAAGFYNQANDLYRASLMLQVPNPNRKKADELFRRGIAATVEKTHESYISYAYYNTYMIFAETKNDAEIAKMKKRVISDYFDYSELVAKAKMSVRTQEALLTYLKYVVKSCEDILPEIPEYIETLPEEKETRVKAITSMVSLLEGMECTDDKNYAALVEKWVETAPESEEAKMIIAGIKGGSEAIGIYREIMANSTDEVFKNKLQYRIAAEQFKMRSYDAAYRSAMAVKGELRGKAMKIAGQAVAANANNCGTSTFERKCNYVYAVQLLQQASGEAVGGLIANYKKNYPTDSEIFDNGSPASVSLVCYGVSVNPRG